MPNCLLPLLFNRSVQRRKRDRLLKLVSFLLLGFMLSWASGVHAQTETPTPANVNPEPASPVDVEPVPVASDAPAELLETIASIDAAASQQDLETVMSFYSPTFSNSDGLTYDGLQQALENFWERYANLTYATQVNDWERDGNAIVATTTTTITGTERRNGNALNLSATITSQQRFEDLKIASQEILAEQSQVTQGQNPPTVEVILPEQVGTGQKYEFDVIVLEPLGDRLLLGAAAEEAVQPSAYLDPTDITLELLSSGGLFKIGTAPATPETRWVSAILIRDDGITTVARRLQVVAPSE
ncbi:nuclear transport factor 2 family protein [Thermocoleostomius sinensis]|uniref:Nuclear transport factor 2 family protein n=1 Tax=Thermocoleostomius sinensis A174 TaxID=2016057 RepID=A0A9E8ZF68_9CYAN|nr:nuclear transport factor 2 family protein [Thermocoleostomius sinensis]WAL60719.1 nuclear transport factor 2 family protein [Thermocoleostomius sinensis A174]